MRDRQILYLRLLGIAFYLAGVTVIVLGWNAMVKGACPDCQLPYLLSAGGSGIALTMIGVALLVIAQLRVEGDKIVQRVDGLTRDIGELGMWGGTAPADAVVAGDSTYHRPGCRLLVGKEQLRVLNEEWARASGLTRCRLCQPEESDGGEIAAPEEPTDSAEPADQAGAPK